MTPFDFTIVKPSLHRTVIRTVASAYGEFTFTDVTFAYRGEFYGARFPGVANLQHELNMFAYRQRNRDWDRKQ